MRSIRPAKGQRLAGFVNDSRPLPLQMLAGGVSVGSILTGANARERETLAAAARDRDLAVGRRREFGQAVLGEYRVRNGVAGPRLPGGG